MKSPQPIFSLLSGRNVFWRRCGLEGTVPSIQSRGRRSHLFLPEFFNGILSVFKGYVVRAAWLVRFS